MLKHLHLLFVSLVFISFISRVFLAEFNPVQLQRKWLKIAPHVLDSLLLLSGIGLVIQGRWLSGDFGWILAKLLILIVYIGLGVLAMRQQGQKRWLASVGAVFCLFLIAKIAVSKKIFLFF